MADAERLEADLRALFGPGSLEIGEVTDGMIRNRTTAESIRFDNREGERLLIDRYVVSGDYDQPDEVTLEGIRVEDSLTDLLLMSVERVVFGEPAQAVLPTGDLDPDTLRLGSLAIDNIVIELASDVAHEVFEDTPMAGGTGRLTIDSLHGKALSHQAIGLLNITGIAGTGSDLGDMGEGSFTLAGFRVEGLRGLDQEEGEQTLDSLELTDFAVESDQLVGALTQLRLDGNFADGEGGLWLDAFQVDLAKMIAMAPEEERTQLRMISNVLTDGSGDLRLDAAFTGNWAEEGDHSLLTSDSHLTIAEALRLAIDINLPVLLPAGTEPADIFTDDSLLQASSLLGGDIQINLNNQGLFGRLLILGAAMEGISEAQYLNQARTQAQGFGMMFGPEIQAIFTGLVEMMAGTASELAIGITLPAESNLETYTGDPLALPDKLSLQVETR
jgi:hypothetical protein